MRAIREHVHDALKEQKIEPMSVEGVEHNQWVLCDFGAVVLHVFYEPVRDFYQLERLWNEAPRVEFDAEALAAEADAEAR